MEPKFYFNRFIYSLFGLHFIIYLCWSFVEFSLLKPIQQTFETSDSRGFYVIFLFCALFSLAPFYAPFENKK